MTSGMSQNKAMSFVLIVLVADHLAKGMLT